MPVVLGQNEWVPWTVTPTRRLERLLHPLPVDVVAEFADVRGELKAAPVPGNKPQSHMDWANRTEADN